MHGARIRAGAGWWLAHGTPGLGVLMLAVLLAVPAGAEVPRPTRGPLGERDVTMLNHSPRSINEIYISPEISDQWGDDRLGDRTLDAGGSLRLHLGRTRECMFDAKVIYDDASREEHRGVNLCRTHQLAFDGSTATAPPETGIEHSVTLVNHSPRPIQQVFISPAEANQWGDDRLGQGSISVDDRQAVTWRGDCNADLRVVFENRSAEERRGVDLCDTPVLSIEPGWTTADQLPMPPGAATPQIAVSNRSGQVVTELRLRPDGKTGAGQDLLGATVLPNGTDTRLPFDRGPDCRFSAQVVFGGKTPDTSLPNLDLCTTPQITIPPR